MLGIGADLIDAAADWCTRDLGRCTIVECDGRGRSTVVNKAADFFELLLQSTLDLLVHDDLTLQVAKLLLKVDLLVTVVKLSAAESAQLVLVLGDDVCLGLGGHTELRDLRGDRDTLGFCLTQVAMRSSEFAASRRRMSASRDASSSCSRFLSSSRVAFSCEAVDFTAAMLSFSCGRTLEGQRHSRRESGRR